MREFETLLFENVDGVGIITLNRPEKLNSADEVMCREIRQLYRELRFDDTVRSVVLTAAGDRAFCTGIDREYAMDNPQPSSAFMTDDHMLALGPKQADLWKPVVAAVNGMACGGAFYALGESEIIVAADHATFFDPHTTYGMPACYEPILLFGQLPWGELCRIALLGNYERMSAQRAERLGFVSEVVPLDQLRETALTVATQLASLPVAAVQGTLRSLWAARTMARQHALSAADLYVELGSQADAKEEGHAAFTSGERVKPRIR
jgi:enoyl-CoA hydratase/carnithine racemase